MHNIAESDKVDTALQAQTGQTSLTGEWFKMTEYAKALFLITVQGQLTGASLDFKVYEATNAEGDDEQQLGATIAMAQGIKLGSCQITVDAGNSTVDETLVITPYTFVNGVLTAGTALTFTAKASETLSSRYFDQSGTPTEEATSLAACINDETYGVPGVLATAAAAVVTLTMTEPGDGVFTITESAPAELVVIDLVQQAYFEVAVQDMDRDDDFTHIGARVSGVDETTEFACVLIRAVAGYLPVGQAVAYSDDAS